jgi:hypothetical protein
MLADHFTKPLQGNLFRKFRADIQGISADLSDVEWCWERVEKCDQKASTDPSTQECVQGTAEGSPGDPSGTCADDPANRVCDPGQQEGTKFYGKDTHVRTARIRGAMRTPTAPISGAVCTHTAPSNAWTVVSRKGTRGYLGPLAGNVQEIRNLLNTQSLLLACGAVMWVAGAALKP